MKQKLLFKDKDILNWSSDFTSSPKSKTKKSKPRVYTPFHMAKTTHFKGLNLVEYIKGKNQFVIFFRLKGQLNKLRLFTVGKFDCTQGVITGETKFETKQCQARLLKIAVEHQDDYALKNRHLSTDYNPDIF